MLYTLTFEDNAIWVDAIDANAASVAIFEHAPKNKEIYAYCNENWPISEGYQRWENVDICWTQRAEIAKAAAAMGRKGGAVKSEKKTAAARENAKKPRPNRRKKEY